MSTQREIKFRCWHPGHVGRVRVPASMFYDTWSGECLKFLKEGQPVVVMQYTGLRDKNGKEIYEGDVVKVEGDRYNDLGAHIQFTGYVVMEQAGWRLRNGTRELSLCDQFSHSLSAAEHDVQFDDGEVIGNIHENPDLIP